MSHSSSESVSTSPGPGIPSPSCPPRKRRHSTVKNGLSQSKKQKLSSHSNHNFQPSIQEHFPILEADMAQAPPTRSLSAPNEGTNHHKMYLNNHSKTPNQSRKPGQGKKLVIKNLKCMFTLYMYTCIH